MRSKILQLATITICTVIIYIYFNGTLQLYIHPRYLNFTFGFVLVGLMLLTIDSAMSKSYLVSKSGWLVVVVAAVSLFLPPQSLSGQIAVSRENQSQYQNNSPLQTTYDSFSSDLTRFGVADWSRLLSSSPSPNQVVGKQASVDGFIFENEQSQRFIARFQLTCCAVDATPLTVPLLSSERVDDLQLNSWVQIIGIMVISDSSEYPFQLDVTEIQQIPEPKDPYVY
jgi:putative membrane protein